MWIRIVLDDAGMLPRPEPDSTPVPPVRGPWDPVTLEEMEALCEAGLSPISMFRATAGLLEALGHGMTLDEANAWVGERLKYGVFRLTPAGVRGWRSDLIHTAADGRLLLHPRSADLPAMRSAIHARAHIVLRHRAEREHRERIAASWKAREADEKRRNAVEAATRRHAILHVVPSAAKPVAGVILDVEARTFTTFTRLDRWSDTRCLEGFDVVLGLDVRNALLALGVDPELFHLVDLGPPQKTKTIDRSGRKLLLTTDLLMRAARSSTWDAARWIALDEPDLLRLPAKYDHDAVKAVVSYAIARATRGKIRSKAMSYELDERLLSRLVLAPGPHDEAQCVDAALTGLERMMAFHVASRSRSRYARAAAYWSQHGALCQAFDQPARHLALRVTFAEELRRLPALRDELNRASAVWR